MWAQVPFFSLFFLNAQKGRLFKGKLVILMVTFTAEDPNCSSVFAKIPRDKNSSHLSASSQCLPNSITKLISTCDQIWSIEHSLPPPLCVSTTCSFPDVSYIALVRSKNRMEVCVLFKTLKTEKELRLFGFAHWRLAESLLDILRNKQMYYTDLHSLSRSAYSSLLYVYFWHFWALSWVRRKCLFWQVIRIVLRANTREKHRPDRWEVQVGSIAKSLSHELFKRPPPALRQAAFRWKWCNFRIGHIVQKNSLHFVHHFQVVM